jgi:hypothetical protein
LPVLTSWLLWFGVPQVRERYPRFSDALGDLDDALSLIHLFSVLPTEHSIKPERTERARRLALEWQYYVAKSHSLSKVRRKPHDEIIRAE